MIEKEKSENTLLVIEIVWTKCSEPGKNGVIQIQGKDDLIFYG